MFRSSATRAAAWSPALVLGNRECPIQEYFIHGLAQGGTLRLFSITKNGDRRLWRIVDELLFREQYLHASGKFTNQRSAVLDADWSDARDEIAGDRSYSLWTRIGFWISEGFL